MSLFVSIRKKMGTFQLEVQFETNEQVTGILGASGSGKSMLLKCIAGIETADEGKIVLNGVTLFDKERKINLPPQKRKVGYLFQNYALFPHMTVEQNVSQGLFHIKDKKERKRKTQAMIDLMMLGGLEQRFPYQLSGGQQQRTALARILVNEPEFLLLDEPFSALDEYLKVHLESEMKHLLAAFGRDAIFVSHNRDEAYRLCGSLAIINQGYLKDVRKVKQVFRNPKSRQGAVLTGCKNIVEAVKSDKYEVKVLKWGICLRTAVPVEENLCAIGIRAHAFNIREKQNCFKISFCEEIEEPFEVIWTFRYETADDESAPIWWRIPKEQMPEQFPEMLGIAPENIMLLYE